MDQEGQGSECGSSKPVRRHRKADNHCCGDKSGHAQEEAMFVQSTALCPYYRSHASLPCLPLAGSFVAAGKSGKDLKLMKS
jgi:hypothetical protein